MTESEERSQNMISVRLGCDIRGGPLDKKRSEYQSRRTGTKRRDRVCLVRQHRQILLGDVCR